MKQPGKHMKYLVTILTIILVTVQCANNANTQTVDNKKYIKIALLLDTSNSMDGLIDQAKAQLWSIVNELAKAKCDNEIPELQIALYEYGNNNLPMSEGYIRMVTPLTSDLDQISEDLFKLTTNGGDEFCGQVIQSCLKQLDWSRDSKHLQLIFIAGNEPFTQGTVNYRTSCTNAKEKNVVVNTIFCGNFNQGINTDWKSGADLTGGNYFSIEQDRKTVFISSPYDDKIAVLNTALNKTYVAYGSLGAKNIQKQRAQDANASAYGQANEVKRAVTKSSHVYKNSSWDLVDAAADEEFEIEHVKEESLPAEMQGMSNEKKKEYIQQKAKEREKIQIEIQALNKKRLEYLAKNASENAEEGMLDVAILSAIKEQAKQKNYVIE